MIRAIDAVVPDIVNDLLDMVVTEAFQPASALITLSVITLLWTSIHGDMALLRGMDSAYNEEEARPTLDEAPHLLCLDDPPHAGLYHPHASRL
ncbi:MAG: hypothetical protein LKE45_08840 [Olsenella sp.]|nr:hypothetical protein [Olsenella sp.]